MSVTDHETDWATPPCRPATDVPAMALDDSFAALGLADHPKRSARLADLAIRTWRAGDEAARRQFVDAVAGAEAANGDRDARRAALEAIAARPGGLDVLVAMRSLTGDHDRRETSTDPTAVDADLAAAIAHLVRPAMLEAVEITWDSPASLLELLIAHEAVHPMRGWADLRRRLRPDRRCYALFHPLLAGQPLVFVEVALTVGLPQSMGELLLADEHDDPTAADTATFYSISICQRGLRGIQLGEQLLSRAIELVGDELGIGSFGTISPVPGLRRWATRNARELTPALEDELATNATESPLLARTCARYLLETTADGRPLDPVARFHLGNGATLERVNVDADNSAQRLAESFGVMVNYRYELDRLERNAVALATAGTIARSAAVDELAERR